MDIIDSHFHIYKSAQAGVMAQGGESLIGFSGTIEESLPILDRGIIHKIVALFTKGMKVRTFLAKSIPEDLEYLSGLVADKTIKPIIDKTFSLEQITEAHEYGELGHTEGKISIVI